MSPESFPHGRCPERSRRRPAREPPRGAWRRCRSRARGFLRWAAPRALRRRRVRVAKLLHVVERATAVLLGFFVTPASARERCRRAASARPPARRRRSWMDASGTGRRSESSNPNRASKPRGVRSTPPARPFANPNRAGARNLGSPRPPPSSSFSRAPRRWTPAEGKNKSSVYKWVPATGELPGEDVESAPSERAKQFEAVPIGEVTVGMPPKPAT